jgi:hypothetical protein
MSQSNSSEARLEKKRAAETVMKRAAEDYAVALHYILVKNAAELDYLLSLPNIPREYKQEIESIRLENERLLAHTRQIYQIFDWPLPDDAPDHIMNYDILERHNHGDLSARELFHGMLFAIGNSLYEFRYEYQTLLHDAIEKTPPTSNMRSLLSNYMDEANFFMRKIKSYDHLTR